MNITLTSDQLHQIIKEEIKRQIIEEQLIEEGVRDFLRRNRFPAAVLGIAMAVLGPLYKVDSDRKEQTKIQNIENALENTIEGNTKAETQKEFAKYLNNDAAFRWGKGGEKMMLLPCKEAAVMPLSYTIASMAFYDKMNGDAPRYGVPDKLTKLSDEPTASPEQATVNMESFFQEFGEDFEGGFYTQNFLDIVTKLPTSFNPETGLYYSVVMVDPGYIVESGGMADYVLPENQKTIKEYYDWVYFSEYLSIEDIQVITSSIGPDNPQEIAKVQQLFMDANPSLVKLQQQAKSFDQNSSTED